MNILAFAHLISFIFYAWAMVFILSRNPAGKLNRICSALVFVMAVWSLAYIFRESASSAGTALFWSGVGSLGWCTFPSLALWFAIVLSGRDEKIKRWLYALIFLVPAIFFLAQITHTAMLRSLYKLPGGYYWNERWANNAWTYLYYMYFPSCTLISVYLLGSFARKVNDPRKARQAMIVAAMTLCSIVIGSFTNVILPNVGIHTPIVANIISLVWMLGVVYAVTKYSLMTVTMAIAAKEIVATMPEAIFVILIDATIMDINEAACELTGYTRKELSGKPAKMLFTEDGYERNGKRMYRDLLEKSTVRNYAVSIRAKDGSEIPVNFSGSVIRNRQGVVIGMVGIARDVREMVRLQEREKELSLKAAAAEKMRIVSLEASQAELENRVALRTAELEQTHLASLNIMEDLELRRSELQEAYEELKTAQASLIQSEKMAAMGQLAAGIAHEINNPMGVILGFAQFITKNLPQSDLCYKPAKSLEAEAARCRQVIVDLLSFSRTGQVERESVHINELIDQTVSVIGGQAKIKNVIIEKTYDGSLGEIQAHRNQIQQILINLCNNAMDAMAEGGTIYIRTKRTDDFAAIEVQDTGTGMPEEVRKHIFEPFYTTKEAGKGTGLGLALCYEFVKKHNGSIEVKSEVGAGTSITILLPA